MLKKTQNAYILLFLTALIWGIAPVVIKLTLDELPALAFLTYRFALASVPAIFSFFHSKGWKSITSNPATLLLSLIYAFITSTIALGFFFVGLEKTTILDSTLIALIGPIAIVFAGAVFLREKVGRAEKIGMAIAIVGTALTVIQPLLEGGNEIQVTGNMMVVIYIVVNTISAVMVKKLLNRHVSAAELTHLSFIVGFITMAPLAFKFYGLENTLVMIATLNFKYHLGVWFMAFVSGTIAYTLWARGQKYVEIGEAAIFSYLYPVFSTPLAVFWINEKITIPFITGAALIMLGVFIAEYHKRKN